MVAGSGSSVMIDRYRNAIDQWRTSTERAQHNAQKLLLCSDVTTIGPRYRRHREMQYIPLVLILNI